MKSQKIIYQVSTGLVVLGILASIVNYLFQPAAQIIFVHVGFPDWFDVELGIAKLFGALALAFSFVPARFKGMSYFGFFVNFFSAFLAHYMVGDPVFNLIAPLVILALVIMPYICNVRLAV